MIDTPDASPAVLLIQHDRFLRRDFSRALSAAGMPVVAVNWLAEALVRTHSRDYALVACTDRQRSPDLVDGYDVLVDSRALLVRNGRYAAYRAAAPVRTPAVLIIPGPSPRELADAVTDIVGRLREGDFAAPAADAGARRASRRSVSDEVTAR